MGTPEDVAAEKHFTPPTLTAMLTRALDQGYELRFESETEAHKRYLDTIKFTIKEWLRTVGMPYPMGTESTRNLLITLVDEP